MAFRSCHHGKKLTTVASYAQVFSSFSPCISIGGSLIHSAFAHAFTKHFSHIFLFILHCITPLQNSVCFPPEIFESDFVLIFPLLCFHAEGNLAYTFPQTFPPPPLGGLSVSFALDMYFEIGDSSSRIYCLDIILAEHYCPSPLYTIFTIG